MTTLVSTFNPGSEDTPSRTHPHLRAQLGYIHRQYKPLGSCEIETDTDDANRVSPSFVYRVVTLLEGEHEDELKALLQGTYAMDDDAIGPQVEQNVLEIMHRYKDDVAGVPFLFLTPTRRPISRPSSRASSHSNRLRPDTPNSAPNSPLAAVFRRPHTPLTSPLASGMTQPASYLTARSISPQPSSSLSSSYTQTIFPQAQHTSSLPSSPLSSPRLLNAKASEFKPIQRPLSAASSNPSSLTALRADTPSPDLWAHPTLRATSKLAIAAPLVPNSPRTLTSSSSLRSSVRQGSDEDEENDPFDPFAPETVPLSFHSITISDFDKQWPSSSDSSSLPDEYRSTDMGYSPNAYESEFSTLHEGSSEADPDDGAILTGGMTPFDVLSSVFGSSLAPSELEDALAANGYDFERAMAWLVDRASPITPHVPNTRTQHMGGRLTLVSREGNMIRGNKTVFSGANPPRHMNGRPAQGGNRVCRYFVAGECLRADCRFSHDLERALCRFWLRGTCAKHESCEFLHHLPKNVDLPSLSLNEAISHVGNKAIPHHQPSEEFPALGLENSIGGRRGREDRAFHDPGRTRFATAVKKPVAHSPPVNSHLQGDESTLAARREAMGTSAESLHHRSAIVAPRPSARLKLRPPSLLPTLSTGEAINNLYMNYRSRALQLGAARNACLSRAADAWRRGDGAAAKRFSREGHELNTKMGAEMVKAAANLVRERAKVSEEAVKTREASWSDDPGDRTSRGRACGGGLGVCLGIASKNIGGESHLTPEERSESVLDLHGLHANEATEVLEEFLFALEREHWYGLAYIIVGETKHTGKYTGGIRLATGVREWLHRWGYPWSERDGIICVDALTHS